MKKYHKRIGLVAAVLLAVTLTGCGSLTSNLGEAVIGEGSGSGETISTGKETFKADDFNKLDIQTDAMAVLITKSETEEATVELLVDDSIESEFKFNASVKSNTLEVVVKEKTKSKGLLNDTSGERKLLISLPDKVYTDLTIDNSFGLVDVSDLQSENMDIQVDAGQIQLKDSAGEMKLEVDSGQIVVEGLSLENDLKASTDAGEIRIILNETPDSAEINLSSDIGAVTANVDGVDFSVNSGNKKVGKIGKGNQKLEASTSVGAIHLEVK